MTKQDDNALPEGKGRAKPGTKGGGSYYRIEVRPKTRFVTFRYHDVGDRGGDLMRLAGKRSSGSWSTQAWLVNKDSAHIEDGVLVGDTEDVRELLDELETEPKQVKGDVFRARDRQNVPESSKPTAAQKKAMKENLEIARQARWQHRG